MKNNDFFGESNTEIEDVTLLNSNPKGSFKKKCCLNLYFCQEVFPIAPVAFSSSKPAISSGN